MILFLILLTRTSSLLRFFCLSFILLIGHTLTLRKEAFKTLYTLLSLFLSFNETACVKISLFKCIFFKLTIFKSTFLSYNFSIKLISFWVKKGFSNLLLLKINNLLYFQYFLVNFLYKPQFCLVLKEKKPKKLGIMTFLFLTLNLSNSVLTISDSSR